MDQTEYDRYLNDLNQYNLDREFNYGQLLDEINNQTLQRQEALDRALTASEFGDFRGLQQQGINPNAQALYDFNRTASGSTGGSGGSGSGSGTSYSQAELLSAIAKYEENGRKLSALKTDEIEILLASNFIDAQGNRTTSTDQNTDVQKESGDRVVDDFVRYAKANGYSYARIIDELEKLEKTGQINERQTSQIVGRLGL